MPGFLEDEASLSSQSNNGELLNQMDLFQFLALALPPIGIQILKVYVPSSVSLWNQLPENFHHCLSLPSFKSLIDNVV